MPQYCDSARLERNWFHWLIATAVPDLEPFRRAGVLWTKIPETVPEGCTKLVMDPQTSERHHCLALSVPHYVTSQGGVLRDAHRWEKGRLRTVPLPLDALDLERDSAVRVGLPYLQQGVLVPSLRRAGYVLEPPASSSWDAMIADVHLICMGVARKFGQVNDEETSNLAHEALTQVLKKLADRKLMYTPGRAPVFNLLTTTVHRCLFSVMNRETKQRNNSNRLRDDLRAGVLPRSLRSLRVPG